MELFEQPASAAGPPPGPLADRMRPRSLDEIVGQEHLLGPGRVVRAALEGGELHSMILWGPPGSGKTTLASLMAHVMGARFVGCRAVRSGVKEIRRVGAEAETERARRRRCTILFVDEIHRFNRAQQDAFLPHVEKGTLVLIGATTENPSFEVNGALLSRCRVYVLRPLGEPEVVEILRRALADRERGVGAAGVSVAEDALAHIARLANGDARAALNVLELASQLAAGGTITAATIREAGQRRTLLYDKSGEEHYNLISALHKSLRDSDPDASLYWMTRMLDSGEDPLYVARRLVRFASEDVGNADPQADRKSTRLNSSHSQISYAVFCLKKKKISNNTVSKPQVAPPARYRTRLLSTSFHALSICYETAMGIRLFSITENISPAQAQSSR